MTSAHRDLGPGPVEYLSIAEAALRYHVSRDFLRDRIIDGSLPAVRSGTRIIRISTSDLARLFRPVQSMRSILGF
jgi:excisionase family DNA binding protein